MLRELKAENERLLMLLNGGKMNTQDVKDFTGKDVVSKGGKFSRRSFMP